MTIEKDIYFMAQETLYRGYDVEYNKIMDKYNAMTKIAIEIAAVHRIAPSFPLYPKLPNPPTVDEVLALAEKLSKSVY